MIRQVRFVVSVVALMMCLVCGTLWASAESETTSAEPTTLNVLVNAGGAADAVTGVMPAFTSSTGIEVVMKPLASDPLYQQQILDLSAGTGTYDIMCTNNLWVGSINPKLEDLNPLFAKEASFKVSDFVSGAPDIFTVNGRLTALPFRLGGRVLVYRTDLFKEAGIAAPPRTFEELKAVAQKLTTRDHFGFVINMAQDVSMVDSWSNIFLGFGGQFLNQKGKVAFDSPAGAQSVEYLIDLYKNHLIPPDAIEMGGGELITAIQQGRVAIAVIYSGWYGKIDDPKATNLAGRFAIAPMPYAKQAGFTNQGPSLLSVWAFGISSFSKHKDAGWKFLKYISRNDAETTMAVKYQNGPTLKATYSDPDFMKAYPVGPQILAAISGGVVQPPIPQWSKISEELRKALSHAFAGDMTPQAAMDQVTKTANGLLGQ